MTTMPTTIPTQSTSDTVASIDSLGKRFEELKAKAPPELHSDVDAIKRDICKLLTGFRGHEPGAPVICERTYSVTYAGKQCVLGNTISFRLLARLLWLPQWHPGWAVGTPSLVRDVWQESDPTYVSDGTIRQATSTLRGRLRSAGMDQLAEAIVRSGGVYMLKPAWRSSGS
jgi:hypothetical protein